MIYRTGSDAKIAAHKHKLGLKGDVYVVNNHIASLASHKVIFPDSMATTIEEAELERILYDESIQRQLLSDVESTEVENNE